MKKSYFSDEISLQEEGFNMSANVYPPRSHYKFIMKIGRVFPTTKAQAKHFVHNVQHLGVLNKDDVNRIEDLLNKYDIKGKYYYTKSKIWVRMTTATISHLLAALKCEYGLVKNPEKFMGYYKKAWKPYDLNKVKYGEEEITMSN